MGEEPRPGRYGPQWGVMYSDQSVTARWNGRTQRERALEELRGLQERHAAVGIGSARSAQVFLVWRPSDQHGWRLDPVWVEEFLAS
jgi:hypothetical protein